METKELVILVTFGVVLAGGAIIAFFLFSNLKSDTERESLSKPLMGSAAYTRSDNLSTASMSTQTPAQILRNFVLMAVCFSANHGAVTGCIGLATNRFGSETKLGADLGTWQLGTLYLTYTMSAMFGAAYVVRKLGSRNGLLAGLSIYCVYVTAFLIAAVVPDETKWPVAITGAAIGGVGGGFLWTAQGKYFVSVSEAYAISAGIEKSSATSYLAGIFSFFYLFEEVVLKLLSSVIVESVDSDDRCVSEASEASKKEKKRENLTHPHQLGHRLHHVHRHLRPGLLRPPCLPQVPRRGGGRLQGNHVQTHQLHAPALHRRQDEVHDPR